MSVFAESVGPTHRQSSGGRTSAGRSTGLESPHWWKDQLIAGLGCGSAAPRRTGQCVSPLAAPPSPLPSDSVITEFRGSNHGPAAGICGDFAGRVEMEINSENFQSSSLLRSINNIDKRRNRYTIKLLWRNKISKALFAKKARNRTSLVVVLCTGWVAWLVTPSLYRPLSWRRDHFLAAKAAQ